MSAAQALVRVRVGAIEPLARGVALFRLAPVEPAGLAPAAAGAHVDVHLPGGLVRQYSLILGMDAAHYLVAVKKDAAGRGGSRAMHEQVLVGQELVIGTPRNLFPLVEDGSPAVLIAGGIGLTPLWSMALRLESLGQPFELHHACRSRADLVFAAQLLSRTNVHLHFDDEAQGVMDVAAICAAAPAEAHLYCCGPAPMLAAFKAATAGRPRERVHWEDFAGAAAGVPHAGFELHLARSRQVLQVRPGQRMVDALREAGASFTVSCEQGICGACETTVLDGEPEHGCQVLSPDEREAGATMMICCGGSRSQKLVLDL